MDKPALDEFDPESETHHPLLIIKKVDPGCTLELQIENCITGEVTRLTTTDEPEADQRQFEEAVLNAFRAIWPALN